MLISRGKAAKMAGVHRQTMYEKYNKNPNISFFIEKNGKIFVDTEDPLWENYLLSRNIKDETKDYDRQRERDKIMISVLFEKLNIKKEKLQEILKEIEKRRKENGLN